MNRNLTLVDSPEASSLGAAILAMRATGDLASLDDAPTIADVGTVSPTEGWSTPYDELYSQYEALYSVLAPHWDAISTWQASQLA